MSEPPPQRPAQPEARFFLITAALLLLIIALLAVLWLRAHNRALAAETQALQLRDQTDAQALLSRLMRDKPVYMTVPREALATRPVELDGRQVLALRLPTELAEALGFRPGEVILVEPAPTPATAPATGPSPASPE
jgi:cbb3-type cytochrome oxidase subunit 3